MTIMMIIIYRLSVMITMIMINIMITIIMIIIDIIIMVFNNSYSYYNNIYY